MVQREPEKRLTAEEYLKQQRGKAFPDIFYTFLQPYIAQFAKDTFQSADERVLVIHKDLENILHNLRGGEQTCCAGKRRQHSHVVPPEPTIRSKRTESFRPPGYSSSWKNKCWRSFQNQSDLIFVLLYSYKTCEGCELKDTSSSLIEAFLMFKTQVLLQ